MINTISQSKINTPCVNDYSKNFFLQDRTVNFALKPLTKALLQVKTTKPYFSSKAAVREKNFTDSTFSFGPWFSPEEKTEKPKTFLVRKAYGKGKLFLSEKHMPKAEEKRCNSSGLVWGILLFSREDLAFINLRSLLSSLLKALHVCLFATLNNKRIVFVGDPQPLVQEHQQRLLSCFVSNQVKSFTTKMTELLPPLLPKKERVTLQLELDKKSFQKKASSNESQQNKTSLAFDQRSKVEPRAKAKEVELCAKEARVTKKEREKLAAAPLLSSLHVLLEKANGKKQENDTLNLNTSALLSSTIVFDSTKNKPNDAKVRDVLSHGPFSPQLKSRGHQAEFEERFSLKKGSKKKLTLNKIDLEQKLGLSTLFLTRKATQLLPCEVTLSIGKAKAQNLTSLLLSENLTSLFLAENLTSAVRLRQRAVRLRHMTVRLQQNKQSDKSNKQLKEIHKNPNQQTAPILLNKLNGLIPTVNKAADQKTTKYTAPLLPDTPLLADGQKQTKQGAVANYEGQTSLSLAHTDKKRKFVAKQVFPLGENQRPKEKLENQTFIDIKPYFISKAAAYEPAKVEKAAENKQELDERYEKAHTSFFYTGMAKLASKAAIRSSQWTATLAQPTNLWIGGFFSNNTATYKQSLSSVTLLNLKMDSQGPFLAETQRLAPQKLLSCEVNKNLSSPLVLTEAIKSEKHRQWKQTNTKQQNKLSPPFLNEKLGGKEKKRRNQLFFESSFLSSSGNSKLILQSVDIPSGGLWNAIYTPVPRKNLGGNNLREKPLNYFQRKRLLNSFRGELSSFRSRLKIYRDTTTFAFDPYGKDKSRQLLSRKTAQNLISPRSLTAEVRFSDKKSEVRLLSKSVVTTRQKSEVSLRKNQKGLQPSFGFAAKSNGEKKPFSLGWKKGVKNKKLRLKTLGIKPKKMFHEKALSHCLNSIETNKATNAWLKEADLVFFANPEKTLSLLNQINRLKIPTLGIVNSGSNLAFPFRSVKGSSLLATKPTVSYPIIGNSNSLNFLRLVLTKFACILGKKRS